MYEAWGGVSFTGVNQWDLHSLEVMSSSKGNSLEELDGESDRRFRGNDVIRITEVKMEILYVRYTSFGTHTATTGFEHLTRMSLGRGKKNDA